MFQFAAPSLGAIGLHVLYDLRPYDEPFAYVRADRVDSALLNDLVRRVEQPQEWVRYDSFYRCWIAQVEGPIEASGALVDIMGPLLGLPLGPSVRCTLQRMAPGDGATAHSDRPLLGYECARLVIQLTPAWRPHMGGRFAVHPDADGMRTTRRHEPLKGTAVAFAMRPQAHHSVEACAAERLTAVLHFEHVGNSAALATRLREDLGAMRFSDLPARVHPLMDRAEATRPERDSLRAATVAWLLGHWGCTPGDQALGYAEGLEPWSGRGAFPAARWVAHLWHEYFPVDAWPHARAACATDATLPPDLAGLLFPEAT